MYAGSRTPAAIANAQAVQRLAPPALADIDFLFLAHAGIVHGARQAGKAGRAGLVFMDVPGQLPHDACALGVAGGLVRSV